MFLEQEIVSMRPEIYDVQIMTSCLFRVIVAIQRMRKKFF